MSIFFGKARRAPRRLSAANRGVVQIAKPTVPTLPKGKIQRRIAAVLREEPRKLWGPTEIAHEIGANPGTVRKALWRLTNKAPGDGPPVVVRVARGLYRAFRDPGSIKQMETPEPELHGIQLTAKLPQNRGWGPPGQAEVAWGSMAARPAWEADPTNGQYHRDVAWEGRAVKVAVSPRTGTVQVSLKAGDDPLAPPAFLSWLSWLEGMLQGAGLVWTRANVVPNSVEMNLDYRSLWLDGAKRLKVQSFVNGWLQAYQRDTDTLRTEVRLNPEDDSLTLAELETWVRDMLGVLHTGPTTHDEDPPTPEPPEPPDPRDPDDFSMEVA